MRQIWRILFSCAVPLLLLGAAPTWNPVPWLADLAEIRAAIESDYPNKDWLTDEREVSLDLWFDRTADAIRASRSDADARRALDRLIERFNDGHVSLGWPSASPAASSANPGLAPSGSAASKSTFCAARGFDARQVTAGTATALPGYRAIDSGGPFQAGLVTAGGKTIGVIRIGVFSPQGYPAVCEQAAAKLRIAFEQPCDGVCDDRLMVEANAILTRGLMTAIERLRGSGTQVLLVDLTKNGGGTEWAEAAARIVSPVSLRSAPISVIRGDAWVKRWRDLAEKLHKQAGRATRTDRAMLSAFANRADAIANGLMPCVGSTCSHLAQAGFASGLVAELPWDQLSGKAWGVDVFSPAQFPYRDSVWKGPLIVLVDDETWSAAEQFSALLQDNSAAVVMGTRTGGAGCGHLDGNEPSTLVHSGAQLELPNCARFRRDGANEVSGVVPDVSTGVRSNDGQTFAGRLTISRIPEAVARAYALLTRN